MKLSNVFGILVAVMTISATLGAATPEEKLAALGHTLPAVAAPVANYVSAVRAGDFGRVVVRMIVHHDTFSGGGDLSHSRSDRLQRGW